MLADNKEDNLIHLTFLHLLVVFLIKSIQKLNQNPKNQNKKLNNQKSKFQSSHLMVSQQFNKEMIHMLLTYLRCLKETHQL
jgi:hypothetical protein